MSPPRRIIIVLLWFVCLGIPVQVFWGSGGFASLAIVGTRDGVTIDDVFRQIYNVVTALQAFQLACTISLILLLSTKEPRKYLGYWACTLGFSIAIGSTTARWFLTLDRGGGSIIDVVTVSYTHLTLPTN